MAVEFEGDNQVAEVCISGQWDIVYKKFPLMEVPSSEYSNVLYVDKATCKRWTKDGYPYKADLQVKHKQVITHGKNCPQCELYDECRNKK